MPQEGFLKGPASRWKPVQLMDDDGNRIARSGSEPDPAGLVELFRWLTFGRVFDQRMISLQRQGRIGTIGSIAGQEGSAAGMAMAMRQGDWLVGSYRELLAYIVHGVPVETIVNFYRGGIPGPFPDAVRALPIQVVIGAQMPQATGVAMAARYRGDDTVVVACCGDGGTSEGDFHEGMNMAGAQKAPVVFFVQNNGWAISVPRESQTASATIAEKAWAYGMPGVQVDGNDAVAVYAVVGEAIAHARRGDGPALVEALTYRVGPHTTSDDPRRYRSDDDVRPHERRDPVRRMRTFLTGEGLYREGMQEEFEEAARDAMTRAVEAAEAMPAVTAEAMHDLVWANPTRGALSDRERQLRELREAGELG